MNIEKECVYRYQKGAGWCKHGIVYTIEKDNELYAIDTYWDSTFKKQLSSGVKCYKVSDISNDLEFVMKLDDIKEVRSEEFYLYDEKDRIWLPMGGWHERYLINKNVDKRIDYIISDLKYKISSAKSKILYLQSDIIRWEEELNKIDKEVL